MDIVYGALTATGEFELRNIRELGYDRDFILKPPHPVLNLELGGHRLQLVSVERIILRASLAVPEVTCHFLAAADLHSALANFTFDASVRSLVIESAEGQTWLRFRER